MKTIAEQIAERFNAKHVAMYPDSNHDALIAIVVVDDETTHVLCAYAYDDDDNSKFVCLNDDEYDKLDPFVIKTPENVIEFSDDEISRFYHSPFTRC
jgi:hypothetical protein